jgi:signal peptidase II
MVAVAATAVVLDQATKAAIVETMALGERTDLALGFDLTRVTNSGIAFGLFSGGDDALVIAFTVVALGLLGTWFALDSDRPLLWLGVGLLAGGALGNLADRLRSGAVTDFFDPPVWPAFNLADVAITVGVAVIALAALRPAPHADPDPAQ